MRYFINFDKTVNQFVPYYLCGRKLILFLQSVLAPLQTLANSFVIWAKEMRIEASMTSQIFKFEWFLNRKFSKYFRDPNEQIRIINTTPAAGLALYYQGMVENELNPVLVNQSEHTENDPVLDYVQQASGASAYSFAVYSPAIDTTQIKRDNYIAELQYWLDRYRLAGKTYIIRINE